ncbi:MAG: carbamoyltransferase, partial [Candidatus Omnitrophica bacterium]|nr:carbamoyltransferase [Candidatus Omnitrophota bacterium]
PFEEAAIVTVDGIGEWATTAYGFGRGNDIKIIKEVLYPHSLGLFYAILTTYLGFNVFEGEGKVMGLSAYGKPKYMDEFKELIMVKSDGSYKLNLKYLSLNRESRMFNKRFEKKLGKARNPEDKIEERHCDIAATLQKVLEDNLILIAKNVYKETKMDKLCLAGGVFLNCVANSRIIEETPFKEVFIQPAAGDNGGAIGVALYINNTLMREPRIYAMNHAYLGPAFSADHIKRVILNHNLEFLEFKNDELSDYVADKLSRNKIIAWFQGSMEFGPRALGNRSILATPCNANMRDILNSKVKNREYFRPFAPAVLEENAQEFFEIKCASPYMLLAPKVKKDKINLIPAVTHVDETARLQTVSKCFNPKFWHLIKAFQKITGIPVLLNTSFNLKGEPIVCSPEDAIKSFQRSNIDYLVMDNFVVRNSGDF